MPQRSITSLSKSYYKYIKIRWEQFHSIQEKVMEPRLHVSCVIKILLFIWLSTDMGVSRSWLNLYFGANCSFKERSNITLICSVIWLLSVTDYNTCKWKYVCCPWVMFSIVWRDWLESSCESRRSSFQKSLLEIIFLIWNLSLAKTRRPRSKAERKRFQPL